MAEFNLQPQDGELQAPPRLAEALRQLPKPLILVPPQVDEAALTRPRLHLARIRQLSGGAQETAAERQDLALAARTGEQAVRPSEYATRGVLGPLERFKRKDRLSLVPWLVVLALLAGVLLLWAWWNHQSKRGGNFRTPPSQIVP